MTELTNKIRTALLHYFIFKRCQKLTCTELSTYYSIADIISLSRTYITEVEVKISLGDLKNELKKKKHLIMKEFYRITSLPNKYYFCFPFELLETFLPIIDIMNDKYGILLYKESKYLIDSIIIHKRAKLLHDYNNTDAFKNRVIHRLANDLANQYERNYIK
jgi:hypothetical protein